MWHYSPAPAVMVAAMAVWLPIICLGQPVSVEAAIQEWSQKTGIIVTRGAREELGWTIRAEAFRSVAGPNSTIPVGQTGQSEISKDAEIAEHLRPDQRNNFRATLSRLLSFGLEPRLRRFPNIKVVVRPAPPRDYAVEINGERYPATELSLYGVPAGPVTVRVIRTTKQPCIWQGWLQESQEQAVACDL